jgi:hypothetical protein
MRHERGDLHPGAVAELAQDVLDVRVDGPLGHDQPRRDVLVGQALRDQGRHLALARRQQLPAALEGDVPQLTGGVHRRARLGLPRATPGRPRRPRPRGPHRGLGAQRRALLPDDRGQPVPRRPAGVRRAQHDRLVHQPDQRVEDLVGAEPVARAKLFGGGQVEAIGENGQAGPQQPLGRRAQAVAPADRRLKRLMAVTRGRAPDREQAQVTGQPGEQLVKSDGAQPERRQLDRERDPVEQPAQPGQLGQPVPGHREAGDRRQSTVGEQADRVAAVVVVDGQRRDAEDHLAGQVKRLAAGHQEHRAVARAQDGVGKGGTGVDHVLAGVQDEQQAPAAQLAREPVRPRLFLLAGQAERRPHRARDGARVPGHGQVGEEHPVGERPRVLARHLDREPRLAYATRPGQRDQPRPG